MTERRQSRALIQFSDIRKTYKIADQQLTIFDGLDLAIAEGEFLAIMGPSGSGKSTLLNMLCGIDKPNSGALRVGDTRLDQMGERAATQWRAHHLGIVFQFYNLMPMLTAGENVELPLLLKPLSRKERHDRVRLALDLVGLRSRQDQRPNSMSGGQQQRVGIARAIVADPPLIVCDEPTGDLDRASAQEILAMLGFLSRERGKTIVMVTHDDAAARQADRVLHLNKGSFLDLPLSAKAGASSHDAA